MYYLFGNWKMNFTEEEALRQLQRLQAGVEKGSFSGIQFGLFPSALFLSKMKDALGRKKKILLGAQHMYFEQSGGYTGETSPLMLAKKATHTLVGHSERRVYFAMTDEHVSLTVRAALDNRLSPVVCIGENEQDYRSGATYKVLRQQLKTALHDVSARQLERVIIAYEPLWAISTLSSSPSVPTEDEIVSTMLWLRKELRLLYSSSVSLKTPLLYGGSVNAENIATFVGPNKMDGALVGGASLDSSSFLRMANVLKQQ